MTRIFSTERGSSDRLFTHLVMRLDGLCMLEVAAVFADNPLALLRAADLTLLGYATREAEMALFGLARLGLIEPLTCRDDAEFAVVADPMQQALLACFGAALHEPLFRQAVTLEVLTRDRG